MKNKNQEITKLTQDKIIDGCMDVGMAVIKLLETKALDYDNDGLTSDDYWLYGVYSINDALYTDALRIRSLLAKLMSDGNINRDSLENAAMDLIAHGMFMLERIRRLGGVR